MSVVMPFGLLLLPTSQRDYGEIGVAAVVGLALITVSAAREVASPVTSLVLALGFLFMVALVRDGAGGGASGFGGLFLLPIVYLALFAGQAELIAGLAGMAAANVAPLLLVGSPQYPLTTWRGTLVQVTTAALAGFTIQRLVGNARLHAGEVTAQNDRLRELDRLKDEFVSLVSHELRTPLTSISGYLELLADEGEASLSDVQHSYLDIVDRNVLRLSKLVEDLLYVARLEAGRLELKPSSVDLADLLAAATQTAEPSAKAKDVSVSLELDPLPHILGDCEGLAQLLDNLISNAVKFTPSGGRVSIHASKVDDGVRLEIADTGIGIPQEEIPHLFERFYRASTAKASETPGTGLGLAISQSIASAHGACITASSTVGVGTTFSLTLPFHQPSPERA